MSSTPAARRQVIIDTDGGVDDAAAIFYLVTQPEVEVLALTVVHGNVSLQTAGEAVCKVLDAAGRSDIPVALGEAKPMGDAPPHRSADFIHGLDGLGNTNLPLAPILPIATHAVDLIAQLVAASPGVINLVTLGPLSNIGRFIESHHDLVGDVDEIVMMGGTARGPGNARPLGEANITHDPVAAAAVFAAGWAKPGLMVGLDVTNRATFGLDEFTLLGEHRNRAAAFLDAPLRFYRQFSSTFALPGETPCHDLTAAMAFVDDSFLETPLLPVVVDTTGGPAWGATVVDLRAPHFARVGPDAEQSGNAEATLWRVALDLNLAAFRVRLRAFLGDSDGTE